jgi:mannose/fructose-specific phosphotransferase system component IIA
MSAGIIITGHGKFASGFLSAVNQLTGSNQNNIAVNFLGPTEDLRYDLEAAIEKLLEKNDHVYILCDLAGGTPFNSAAALSVGREREDITVLYGANIPMFAELYNQILLAEIDVEKVVSQTKKSIGKFELKLDGLDVDLDGLDGLL